jgi:hypothetical protein
MIAYGARMSRNRIDLKGIVEYWTERVLHLLEACARDRGRLPEGKSIDVPFHEFMADDLAMVRKIYDKAGLPMTAQAAAELQDFIDNHPRGKHGRVIYDLEWDFGVDPDDLRQRFQFYFDAFPVQAESRP